MDILFTFPRLEEFLIVEELLATDGLLFDAQEIDSDHPCRLINNHCHDFERISCLLDRNIVSDLISLVSGRPVPEGPAGNSLRLVAGLQAFLNASEIESEPSVAYHEYIDRVGLESADSELALFRSADNLDANLYLDIALGKRDRVPSESVQTFEPGELLSKQLPPKLRAFERNIVTVKKAIILKANGLDDYSAMLQLTDWLYHEYMFTMPAFHFLSLYLSNGRIRRMLKSHHVRDVRNATWDLCFLQEWLSRIKREPNVRWLAATRDKAIKDTARLMFIRHDETVDEYMERLAGAYSRMWGTKHQRGKELLRKLAGYIASQDNPERNIVGADSQYIKKVTTQVEEQYLACLGRD